MTRITTECSRCGRVEVAADDLTLVVSPSEHTAWYLFDCAGCVEQVVREASKAVVGALTRLGIAVREVPAEVLERRSPGTAHTPPLRVDDLLDLMLGLRA